MSTPTLEQVNAALATVNDPEIKRPITELGMVENIDVDDTGLVRVTVLLTVAGCPMRNEIQNRVTGALLPLGITSVALDFTVMTDQEREDLRIKLHGNPAGTAGQG